MGLALAVPLDDGEPVGLVGGLDDEQCPGGEHDGVDDEGGGAVGDVGPVGWVGAVVVALEVGGEDEASV
jgi:hypothetical protein